MTLSYGRVGDWYVVCTQDRFFERCLDAQAGRRERLEGSAELREMGVREVGSPLLTLVVRPQPLAAHLQGWVAHWQAVRPEVADAARVQPQKVEGRVIQGATVLAEVLRHFRSVSMQAYRDGEDLLRAEVAIRRAKIGE
jgi:hypothetical protein